MWKGATMKTSREVLEQLVAKYSGINITVVGDLILDHYIWGGVERISPEAPVVVVNQKEENYRLGGAGNVARNLTSLGAKVSIAGVVGDDLYGQKFIEMLERDGINVNGVIVDRTRPTTVKTRVIANSQQVVRVDRESSEVVSECFQNNLSDWLKVELKQSSGLIVSDYAKGAIFPSLFQCLRRISGGANEGKACFPVLIDPKSPNFSFYSSATVIKPNRKEAEESSHMFIRSRKDAIEAGRKLAELWNSEMIMITLGEMGIVVVPKDYPLSDAIEVDTIKREVFDVSGAGDTVSAVFLLSLAVGAGAYEAAILSNCAAGIVVGEVGTATVCLNELMDVISELEI